MVRDDYIVISIIAAMAENGVIGINNKLPWHIPEDLKRFKQLTYGHPVIMGRKTCESIVDMLGNPLPGRPNIVISKSGFELEGIHVVTNIKAAVRKSKELILNSDGNEAFIIGGAQLFAQSMLFADRIYLTTVHKKVKGDAYFPRIDMSEWKKSDKQTFSGDPSFTFMTLDRTV